MNYSLAAGGSQLPLNILHNLRDSPKNDLSPPPCLSVDIPLSHVWFNEQLCWVEQLKGKCFSWVGVGSCHRGIGVTLWSMNLRWPLSVHFHVFVAGWFHQRLASRWVRWKGKGGTILCKTVFKQAASIPDREVFLLAWKYYLFSIMVYFHVWCSASGFTCSYLPGDFDFIYILYRR